MIVIKNKTAIRKMEIAGAKLLDLFTQVASFIRPGITTLDIDSFIANQLKQRGLTSRAKGYMGYKYVSCISVNDVVVHGVPSAAVVLKDKDLVKVDLCASYKGYCADMARCFFIGDADSNVVRFVEVAQKALDAGIAQARAGNRLSDISAAVQTEVEKNGFGIVREFAGHGIGKQMHEDPEILNYGKPGQEPVLRPGMTFAIEPMITMGKHNVYIAGDGWTVKTEDKSLAAHVEDTVLVTSGAPKILTRLSDRG
ncbi:type I methionyl aminopeptidase [Candidatus Dependentiae bacterium]|nr:type I methionyl aminopeptidase [Candidatus Dependentiae bacterium]